MINETLNFFVVKLNSTKIEENNETKEQTEDKDSEELTHMIDKAIDSFFDNHVVKFNALGRDFEIPKNGKFYT